MTYDDRTYYRKKHGFSLILHQFDMVLSYHHPNTWRDMANTAQPSLTSIYRVLPRFSETSVYPFVFVVTRVVLWCKRRKSGKTPPFSPRFQPICMKMCPLHIIREGKASKHAQSKLLILYPFYLVFTWFLLEKHFGPLLGSYTLRGRRCHCTVPNNLCNRFLELPHVANRIHATISCRKRNGCTWINRSRKFTIFPSACSTCTGLGVLLDRARALRKTCLPNPCRYRRRYILQQITIAGQ